MRRGPRNLQIVADGIGLTQFGGVALIEHFFQRLGLRGAFARHIRFVQRNNRYSVSNGVAGTGFSYEVLYAGGHAASGTEVIVDPAVRVAYIHLRGEAATDAGRQKVRDALASHPEFTDVLGPSDLAGLHAGPKLGDLVVEAQPPWSFAMNDVSSGEKGAHGSRAELGVPLLLSGAGIGPTPPTSPGLVDVAPTTAALLHAPCPANAQGRALTEAFSGPAACT